MFNILPSFSFIGEVCIESVYMPRVLLGPWTIWRTNKAEGLSWRSWLLDQRKRKALPIFPGHDGEPRLGSTSTRTIKIICKITEGKAGVGALSRKWVGEVITRKSSCSERKAQRIRRGHSHKGVSKMWMEIWLDILQWENGKTFTMIPRKRADSYQILCSLFTKMSL